MREYCINRETGETKVRIELNLDDYKTTQINTPISFLSHMLQVFSFHSGFSLVVEATSLDNDTHHLTEDVAIALGRAFKEALGDKQGINRYGWSILPMDEALVMSSVDISGRPHSTIKLNFKNQLINDLPVDLIHHFFDSFAANSSITLHIQQMNGFDDHHIAEAAFKSLAHSLAFACRNSDKYKNRSTSSKGVI